MTGSDLRDSGHPLQSPLEEHITMTRAAWNPAPPPPPKPAPPPPGSDVEFKEATDELTQLREVSEIGGEFGGYLMDKLWSDIGDDILLGSLGWFKVLYTEEAADLGFPADEDDPCGPLYLRRIDDGVVFEVEVEGTARRAERKPVKADAV